MINVLLMPTPAGPNTPGLIEINIALADTIISIPEINDNYEIVSSLVVKEGATLYRFFTSHLDASYTNISKVSDEGEFREHSIVFPIPCLNEKIEKVLKKFIGRDLIVITSDFKGKQLLIGNKEFPLFRKITYSTGGDSGINGYKVEIEGSTPDPPIFFTGELILVNNDDTPPVIQMIEFDQLEFNQIEFY